MRMIRWMGCTLMLALWAGHALAADGGGVGPNSVIRYEKTDFPGNDIDNSDARSFEDCGNQCLADRRCIAFTFASGGTCYKKSTTGRVSSTVFATSGFIASRGVAPQQINVATPPPPLPSQPGMPAYGGGGVTRYDATDFPGSDIAGATGVARNYEDCAQRCLADGRCGAFTFNLSNGNCIPKGGAGAPHRDDRAVSGVVNRAAAAPVGGYPAVSTPSACSVGGTGKCAGCSVSCPGNERAVCSPGVEGVTPWCAREASCRCTAN